MFIKTMWVLYGVWQLVAIQNKIHSYGILVSIWSNQVIGQKNFILIWDYSSLIWDRTQKFLAYSWKFKCSLKLKHFVWQIIPCSLPVTKNLCLRELNATYNVKCVVPRKNLLIMFSLNLFSTSNLGDAEYSFMSIGFPTHQFLPA